MQIDASNIYYNYIIIIICGFIIKTELLKIKSEYIASKIVECQYDRYLRNIRYP